MKRKPLTMRGSRRLFRKSADNIKKINLTADSMRGGIRM